ncbi:ECF RNA polymerase sigma factor SigH [Pelagimonas phthalicica]|uniref:ECF RNA polymerase sigma factor SigH n=2 Tax=Pelagimonas phthalicica TaxID=1037362 RepID=A0A238JDD1_9RHOB|nr:ECF RNA polymerase sigma factor SigH [Pelagimonas phthalicica]
MRALENADKFQPGSSLDAWLFTMTRRVWLNEKRAERIRGAGAIGGADLSDLPAPDLDTETNILARQVLSQVMALPEAQRSTVLLVYVEGYKYSEAAEILDIPIGTIMSRLASARKKLQSATQESETRSNG